MIRFFFCLNQVSYIVASEAAKKLPGNNILIVMPNRVRVHPQTPVRSYRYRVSIAVIVLALSLMTRKVEVVLPHTKAAGRLTRWMFRYAKSLSCVDDGMDTFRDKPKNVELDWLRPGMTYYTFDYGMPVAKWVMNIRIVPVCPIGNLSDDVKPVLLLKEYGCLIVESPGVDLDVDFSCFGALFCIAHPNPTKKRPTKMALNSESGANYSVEKTVLAFDGNIVLGETMVLVFALLCLPDLSRIHVRLTEEQYRNLTCLHPLLGRCGSCLT